MGKYKYNGTAFANIVNEIAETNRLLRRMIELGYGVMEKDEV